MSELETRVGRLEAAVTALANLELGDSEGHPFRGNQYSGGSGGEGKQSAESIVKSFVGDSRDKNIDGRNPEARAAFAAILKGPVPSIKEADGKALALRVAAELDKAGLPRNSGMNGGNLTGITNSQGSTGFSFHAPDGMFISREKDPGGEWVQGPKPPEGTYDAHVVVSGKAAGLEYTDSYEARDEGGGEVDIIDLHTPDDKPEVRDRVQGVFEKMGMNVESVRQTGTQLHWDDDVDYTLRVTGVK